MSSWLVLVRRSALARALAVSLALLPVLPGCGILGGDEEEDPPAELVDFRPTLRIREAWDAGIGDGAEGMRLALVPAVDGSRVFAAASDGRIAAFDATRGRRLWRTGTDLALSAGPATDGAVVVAGARDGELVALSADDGRQLWRTTLTSEVLAAPALGGGFALVRTVDGKLTALRLTDGSQAWFVQQSVPRLSVRGTGPPVVAGAAVICGFDNGRVAAYQLADGSVLWDTLLEAPSGRNEIERLVDIDSTVAAVGDDLYAVSYQGRIAQIALESGQIFWSQEIPSHRGLAADAAHVYVSGSDGTLAALTRATGREVWRHDLLHNRGITGPVAYGASVAVGDFAGFVHFFAADTGEPQARVRAGRAAITSAPVVAGDMLFVQTEGGDLVALHRAD